MIKGFTDFGYRVSAMTPIGIASLLGAILYLVPQTSALGAIILTGYLGGAIATHVRANDGQFAPALVMGILIWLALYLRDEKLRTLLPVRR